MSDSKQELQIRGEKVSLRAIHEGDLPELYELIYGEKESEWKKWDAPYYPLEYISFDEYREETNKYVFHSSTPHSRMIIEVHGEIIGTVNYYWEHKESLWLEVGIVIYKAGYWNGGYGTDALRLWIDYLFSTLPLVRIGLSTWSGNKRMMKVAEKLGMKLEGQIRKARLYQDEYFDSIKMGMLREEWAKNAETIVVK